MKDTHSSSEEGQHLIHQLGITKVSTQHHRAENISLEILRRGLGRGQHLPFLTNDVVAEASQETRLVGDDRVQAPRHTLGDPLRQDEVHSQKGHFLGCRLQDTQEALSNRVIAVLQGAEVTAHCDGADDIKGEATDIDTLTRLFKKARNLA